MAQQQEDEMEYVADDNEMAEVEDDMYFRGRVFGDSESESDDDDEYDSMVRLFLLISKTFVLYYTLNS